MLVFFFFTMISRFDRFFVLWNFICVFSTLFLEQGVGSSGWRMEGEAGGDSGEDGVAWGEAGP